MKLMEYYYVVVFNDEKLDGAECTAAFWVTGMPFVLVSPKRESGLIALERVRQQDPTRTFKLIRFKRDGEEL